MVHNRNETPESTNQQPDAAPLSRRSFLAGVSATAAGIAAAQPLLAHGQTRTTNTREIPDATGATDAVTDELAEVVVFDDEHQAGIRTAEQAHCSLIGFNFRAGVDADDVRRLLTLWTEDARRLTAGTAPLGDLEPEMAKAPAHLTITCGFGPGLFEVIGKPAQRPAWLEPLPAFERDELDDKWGQTDLVLQLCCDDQLTLAHAQRHMIRSAMSYVSPSWIQLGFLPQRGAREGGAPRNLFGLKDGTVNPNKDKEYNDIVWIDEGPDWLHGGTCLVLRRIAFKMFEWEKLDRASREQVFGRKLDSGAPLTGKKETDTPDYEARDSYGLPVIDPTSHMARATNPADKPNQKLRRRAYSYDLPPEPDSEDGANSGLLFICFQQDPREQFIPIQQRLDTIDRLNQWVTHIGSAVYACPPGTDAQGAKGRDTYWGQSLLEG
ncbi:Dyp-type peroxidase [Corynebacterium choanae]|uniref:Putative deferrochelatase/peroxidase EfeN n=1 Tax=Corynebacterium choanae TaxID=1862358 RepID=A0A3G6J6I6_9CORY|nr:Dyp-type peroxidase [Corynebacterium choanae]AZA13715.1 putative deferrochelatase/peroxidase EfeN precursor [Corynebacterium choanae]